MEAFRKGLGVSNGWYVPLSKAPKEEREKIWTYNQAGNLVECLYICFDGENIKIIKREMIGAVKRRRLQIGEENESKASLEQGSL